MMPKEQSIIRHPYFGKIVRVEPDRGFSIIQEIGTTNAKNKNARTFIAHNKNEYGGGNSLDTSQTLGSYCSFAIGIPTHESDRLSAVSWNLEEIPSNGEPEKIAKFYADNRNEHLSKVNLNTLLEWLNAEWYKKLWSGSPPKNSLRDPLLEGSSEIIPIGISFLLLEVKKLHPHIS